MYNYTCNFVDIAFLGPALIMFAEYGHICKGGERVYLGLTDPHPAIAGLYLNEVF
jgi:hypothetical protein